MWIKVSTTSSYSKMLCLAKISLARGQRRLGGVTLIANCRYQPTLEENGRKEIEYAGYEYTFEIKDTLLGEKVTFPWDNISNEESMRVCTHLKFSLLLYDALLILAGSSIASFSAGENAAFAFLTGGISGLLYLLLLQRSVDGLPAPSSSVNGTDEFAQVFGRFKVPLLILVLALTFAVIAGKYGSGDVDMALTPMDLMFWMLGFLACKVAVVLAAFKPMPIGLEENS
ncbi:hypothetical protein Acr_28g0014960 [Actinidia rufa]|uniref:DUF7755 domain-containing protein n=1 Tax=Actinidia rufa TaxID=165716 RepID=A0A7J0HCT6_9ERIC|nr:hypothetical protein Acr_28g0014960 [Actinidia rufa]